MYDMMGIGMDMGGMQGGGGMDMQYMQGHNQYTAGGYGSYQQYGQAYPNNNRANRPKKQYKT